MWSVVITQHYTSSPPKVWEPHLITLTLRFSFFASSAQNWNRSPSSVSFSRHTSVQPVRWLTPYFVLIYSLECAALKERCPEAVSGRYAGFSRGGEERGKKRASALTVMDGLSEYWRIRLFALHSDLAPASRSTVRNASRVPVEPDTPILRRADGKGWWMINMYSRWI